MMFVIYICDVREIYVLVVDLCDGIYIYLSFVWMKIKKQFFLKFLWTLPRALTIALGKEIQKTNNK